MSVPVESKGGQAIVQVKHGEHVMEKIVLVHPSSKSSVDIYLQGATVTSWKILGQELLYLSPKANFAPGKAIRGGVPVVFPQFGPGVLPQHGFARNSLWTIGETSVVKESGDISCTFTLEDNPTTRAVYPHHFKLTLTVLLKPTALSMQLKVDNRNADGRTMPFTTLLHTYLLVDSVTKTTVRGLQNRQYVDQVDGKKIKTDPTEAVIFREEVDRMYIDGLTNAGGVRVQDGGNCEILVKASGFRDVVVWNPHIAKTKGMSDMPEDDWTKFVCVEPGAVIEPIIVKAGESWTAAQGLSIQMTPDVAQTVAEKSLATGGKL